MAAENDRQSEIEHMITGMWHNLSSDYLWDFRLEDDGQRTLIIIHEKKPFPGSWHVTYNVIHINDDNILLELWLPQGISQHRIDFLSDKVIRLQNPPVDKAQNGSITLNKV